MSGSRSANSSNNSSNNTTTSAGLSLQALAFMHALGLALAVGVFVKLGAGRRAQNGLKIE